MRAQTIPFQETAREEFSLKMRIAIERPSPSFFIGAVEGKLLEFANTVVRLKDF
jgi:hypothetical protein